MKALKGWLALFFVLLYLLPLNGRLLWQPDETRYAEISREMLQRNDWTVPQLLGLRYFEKPVAGYWFNNISQWLFGDNNFAVRFASVFSIFLSACLLYFLAIRLWQDKRIALTSVLIFISFLLVYGIGTYSVLDPMFSLWMCAAMVSFYLTILGSSRKEKIIGYLLLGLSCGMGFMTKGFLAWALPVISVLPWAIEQKRFKEVCRYGGIAVLTAVAISLPWVLTINHRDPDYWRYFFWVEHIQRFAEKDAQHKAPFWYYLPVLLLGCLPWLGHLAGTLSQSWRNRKQQAEQGYLFYWLAMPFILFSIAKGKLPTYILPCFAPLALLMAKQIGQKLASQQSKSFRINGIINMIVGCLLFAFVALSAAGILKQQYQADEFDKVMLGSLCFIGWAVFGFWSWRKPLQRWYYSAGCLVVVALLVGYSIPQRIIDGKNPQAFIRDNLPLLQQSRYLLSDSVGTAAGMAWELKRSDVFMYTDKGELRYGLSYPDSASHYISAEQFPQWLAQARQQGNVAILLHDEFIEPLVLVKPDKLIQRHKLAILWYKQTP